MTETERIGKYNLRVECAAPADGDLEQRRIDALTAWLLARWETLGKETNDGDTCAAE